MKRAIAALILASTLPAVALAEAVPLPTGAPASDADRAVCVFKVVHASQGGDGSMDPAITMLREDLKKPPFTAWKTFKLLARNQQELAPGGTATFATPDGHAALLTYTGHVLRKGKHAIKAVLDFRGEGSEARTSITLDEGGHFVVAGHKFQNGILIYAVTCKIHG